VKRKILNARHNIDHYTRTVRDDKLIVIVIIVIIIMTVRGVVTKEEWNYGGTFEDDDGQW